MLRWKNNSRTTDDCKKRERQKSNKYYNNGLNWKIPAILEMNTDHLRRQWQQETWRPESHFPLWSPLLPRAQVQKWGLMGVEGRRSRVRCWLMLAPASHPGIRSIDRPVSLAQMDKGGERLSVEASAGQVEIHPVSVWCGRWEVVRWKSTFILLVICKWPLQLWLSAHSLVCSLYIFK